MASISPILPITRGYSWTFSLMLEDAKGAAVLLQSPTPSRVRGEFRRGPDPAINPLLGAVDTQDNSLVINSDGSITLTLAKTATQSFPTGFVALDFARVDSGVTTPMGVLLQWPVISPVTASMT